MQSVQLRKGIEFYEGEPHLTRPITFDCSNELIRAIEFGEDNTETENHLIRNIPLEVITNEKELENSRIVYGTLKKEYLQGMYIIDKGNLYYLDLQNELVKICNFNIEAKRIIVIDDGTSKNYIYEMEVILNNNIESKKILLSKQKLVNSNWIKEILGIKYTLSEDSKSYNYLDIYIAELFANLHEEIEYAHVGWRFINGKYVYLHGGGVIGLNDSNIKGEKDKIIKVDYRVNRIEALNSVLDMLNISNDHTKTLPLLLYSHLAVMKELFIRAGVEPKFVLWIYGLTGSMKTSVSKVFFNLFNRSVKEEISATFKDTITGIEIKAFEYKDSVFLVDDFHPTTSITEKRDMERIASDILRRYGDMISKSRSTKNLTRQKEFPPRGLCVITGEDKLGGESTIARYIGIEVTTGDFDSEKLSYHQNNPLILSTHMYHFIYWISKNFELLKDNISQQFDILRGENLGLFKHKRFTETFTIYNIVCDIFLQYCIEAGLINQNVKQEMSEKWNTMIFEVIKTHEGSNLKEDPSIMYLMAIQELVSSNKLKLLRKDDKHSNKAKITGYFDEEKYYLFPQLAFAEVKDFWKHLSIEFPVSCEQTNKALNQLGIIETRIESNILRRTLKIPGHGNDRFLIISIKKMNQVLNDIN